MKEKTDDKWLQVQSVADRLDCTDKHVYSLIHEGALKAMKLGDRAIRVSARSLQDYIDARIINPADYSAPADDPPPKQKKEDGKPQVARSTWMD